MTVYPAYTPTKSSTDSVVVIEGNISRDNNVRMSISDEGTAHIMSLLTDLYSSPDLAVLREYSSNALDSHIEAGQEKPIDITLPSAMNSVFVVQDYGIGMSADTIRTIYSSYGASTKRNNFNQVGAFGLGCKAALTLTQSFTLNSVRDGMRTIALVSREEDGVGTVNVLSEVPTSDPNGVKVTIPIPSYSSFNSHARNFFASWKPGTVLVDGEEPPSLWSGDIEQLDCGHTWIKSNSSMRNGLYVVMGGIQYSVSISSILGVMSGNDKSPVSSSIYKMINNIISNYTLISEVPIGSIDLTPSREDVRFSDRTVKFLSEIYTQVAKSIPTFLTNQIATANTHLEVLTRMTTWNLLLRSMEPEFRDAVTWRGEAIPSRIDTPNFRHLTMYRVYSYSNKPRKRVFSADKYGDESENTKLLLPNVNFQHFYVVEPDVEKREKISREAVFFYEKMLNDFLAESQLTPAANRTTHLSNQMFYIFTEEPDSPWITENALFKRVTSDSIFESAKEIRKKDRQEAGTSPKNTLKYPVLVIKGGTAEVSDRDETDAQTGDFYLNKDDYLLVSRVIFGSMHKRSSKEAIQSMIDVLGLNDIVIFGIASNRKVSALEKRNNVTLKSFSALLDQKVKDVVSSMSTDLLEYTHILRLGSSYDSCRILTAMLGLEKISHLLGDGSGHAISKHIDNAKTSAKNHENIGKISTFYPNSLLSATGKSADKGRISDLTNELYDLGSKYILCGFSDYRYVGLTYSKDQLEHIALYINAVDGKE